MSGTYRLTLRYDATDDADALRIAELAAALVPGGSGFVEEPSQAVVHRKRVAYTQPRTLGRVGGESGTRT